MLSRGETIDSCCSEDTDPVTVLEVSHDDDADAYIQKASDVAAMAF